MANRCRWSTDWRSSITDQGESLATVGDAPGEFGGKVRVVRRAVNPKLFHAWLRDSVYHGSAVKLYGFFVTAEVVTLTLLLLLGANVDRRRRLSAMDGTHRRGTRYVSWRRFNAEQVGPLWWLWLFFSHIRLASEPVRDAIKRSRRWAATPACYRAAGGNAAEFLRRVGVRWPEVEGPGLALSIGRSARALRAGADQ